MNPKMATPKYPKMAAPNPKMATLNTNMATPNPKMAASNHNMTVANLKPAAPKPELPDISIPGIRKLYGSQYSRLGKIMWLIALLLCSVLCLLQIKERINFFLNTSVAVDVKITPNQPLNFPYLTICPRGQGATNTEVLRLLHAYNASLANTSGPFVHLANEMSDLLYLPWMTVEEAWNFTKIPINTITVRTVDENDQQPDAFEHTYSPSVTGMCITIRFSEKMQVFPPVAQITVLRGTSRVRKGLYGYAVVVHEDPYPLSYDCALGGMVIQTQYVTTLTLKANKFIRINTRKSPCIDNHEESYSCRRRCIDEAIAHKINCILPVHDLPGLSSCTSPPETLRSIKSTLQHYINFEWSSCPCPPKCLEMVYDIKWRAEPLRQAVTGVHLRFHSSALEITEESVAYNGVSLFCDTGSILSLLLGVCLLTFLQMIEIAIFSVRTCKTRPRGRPFLPPTHQHVNKDAAAYFQHFYRVDQGNRDTASFKPSYVARPFAF